MKATFDAAAFLRDKFHDTNGLLAYLQGRGLTDVPQYDSMYRWFYRGSIPAPWLATIIWLLDNPGLDGSKGAVGPYVKIG